MRSPWGRPARSAGLLTALLFVLLLLWISALPGALAGVPYAGPGTEGSVPIGDGGASLDLPGSAFENRTWVQIDALPASACRVVLDDSESYAQTRVHWAPGNATAQVYAAEGSALAPFRVAAHWVWDTNGNCTGEVNKNGVTWHVPEARPHVALEINDTKQLLSARTGATTTLGVQVTNAGTIPTRVSAAFELRDGWTFEKASPTLHVPVGRNETISFDYEVAIPRSQAAETQVLIIKLSADNGWEGTSTILLQLEPGAPEPGAASDSGSSAGDAATGSGPAHNLERWEPQTQESPGSAAWATVLVASLAWARRRASMQVAK